MNNEQPRADYLTTLRGCCNQRRYCVRQRVEPLWRPAGRVTQEISASTHRGSPWEHSRGGPEIAPSLNLSVYRTHINPTMSSWLLKVGWSQQQVWSCALSEVNTRIQFVKTTYLLTPQSSIKLQIDIYSLFLFIYSGWAGLISTNTTGYQIVAFYWTFQEGCVWILINWNWNWKRKKNVTLTGPRAWEQAP